MGLLRDLERGVRHHVDDRISDAVDFVRDPGDWVENRVDPNNWRENVSRGFGPMQGQVREALGDVDDKAAGPPSEAEERRQQLLKDMQASSDRFRERLPEFKKEQERAILPTYSQAMEEGTRRTKENYARRGLLQSGLRRKGETDLRGELSKQLAEAKSDISRRSETLANQMETASLQANFDAAAQLMSSAENLYNIQQQNLIARRQSMRQLAAGLGYGLGSYYGNRQPSSGGGGSERNYSSQAARAGLLTSYQNSPYYDPWMANSAGWWRD